MKNKLGYTPGPWRFFKNDRYGQSGNKHADCWVLESNTRKYMAVMEVFALNADPKWRKTHKAALSEHAKTIREVEANARLISLAPELVDALNAMLRCYDYGKNTSPVEWEKATEQARAIRARL